MNAFNRRGSAGEIVEAADSAERVLQRAFVPAAKTLINRAESAFGAVELTRMITLGNGLLCRACGGWDRAPAAQGQRTRTPSMMIALGEDSIARSSRGSSW
jgi:hypothetical protein